MQTSAPTHTKLIALILGHLAFILGVKSQPYPEQTSPKNDECLPAHVWKEIHIKTAEIFPSSDVWYKPCPSSVLSVFWSLDEGSGDKKHRTFRKYFRLEKWVADVYCVLFVAISIYFPLNFDVFYQ